MLRNHPHLRGVLGCAEGVLSRLNLLPGQRQHGQRVVAAVSGGRDSIALVATLAQQLGAPNVIAVVVDHGLREESASEAADVARVVRSRFDVHAIVSPLTWGVGESRSQKQSREKRYNALFEAAAVHGASVIATGHHLDDMVETVAMRLMKKSSLYGLQAISETTQMFHKRLQHPFTVVRPLLGLTRMEITRFCREQGIAWVDDPTNADTSKYLRNCIRHSIATMPFSDTDIHQCVLPLPVTGDDPGRRAAVASLLNLCATVTRTMSCLEDWVSRVLPRVTSPHPQGLLAGTVIHTNSLQAEVRAICSNGDAPQDTEGLASVAFEAVIRTVLTHVSAAAYPPSPRAVQGIAALLLKERETIPPGTIRDGTIKVCKHGVQVTIDHTRHSAVFEQQPIPAHHAARHCINISAEGVWWRNTMWIEPSLELSQPVEGEDSNEGDGVCLVPFGHPKVEELYSPVEGDADSALADSSHSAHQQHRRRRRRKQKYVKIPPRTTTSQQILSRLHIPGRFFDEDNPNIPYLVPLRSLSDQEGCA